jgi:iron complex outermembrane recepter protein
MRASLVATVVASIIGFSAHTVAQASAKRATDIPPQDLAPALRTLVEERAIQIVYSSDLLADRRTQGAAGDLTFDEALTQLLRGSQLTFRYLDENTITIVPAAPSRATSFRAGQTEEAGDVGSAAAAGEVALEEVLVTAQKRKERLLDTPQSVSVVTGADLERLNALQFRDYASTIPSLTFLTSGAGQNQVALRGVTAGADVSATVGIYVDEVPYGSSTPFAAGAGLAYDMGLFDIERIEVLRGPQGTLYGASTMGGLIKYVTREPTLGEFSGSVRLGMSGTRHGDASYDGSAVLNVPLATNVAALRIGGYYAHDGGYIDNVVLGRREIDRSDTSGGRLDLLLDPTEDLSIRLVALSQDIERDGRATADHTLAGVPLVDSVTQNRGSAEPFDQSFKLASATIEYNLPWAALVSISSFQSATTDIGGDITPIYVPLMAARGRSYSAVGQLATNETDRFTQEMRLASTQGGRFDWLAGVFYTKEDSQSDVVVQPYDPGRSPATADVLNSQRPSTYEEAAAFGNLTWRVTDRFDVTGGLRYAENEIRTSSTATGLLAGAPQNLPPARDNVVTYLANARHRLTDRATAYFRFATGYRPGGPNFVTFNSSGVSTGPSSYESDSLDSYELGLHAETRDRRFGIDAATYYIDWSNIQVQVFRPATGFGGIINSPGGATVRGAELAGFTRWSEDLTISASVTWQDAELADASPLDLRGQKGERLPNVPHFMAGLTADYKLSFGAFGPTVGATMRYVGDRTSAFTQTPTGNYHLPEYTALDLRARLNFGAVQAQLFARNVTDERGELSALTGIGTPRVTIMQPRSFGVTVSTSF